MIRMATGMASYSKTVVVWAECSRWSHVPGRTDGPVSYTHLDVYKRQLLKSVNLYQQAGAGYELVMDFGNLPRGEYVLSLIHILISIAIILNGISGNNNK